MTGRETHTCGGVRGPGDSRTSGGSCRRAWPRFGGLRSIHDERTTLEQLEVVWLVATLRAYRQSGAGQPLSRLWGKKESEESGEMAWVLDWLFGLIPQEEGEERIAEQDDINREQEQFNLIARRGEEVLPSVPALPALQMSAPFYVILLTLAGHAVGVLVAALTPFPPMYGMLLLPAVMANLGLDELEVLDHVRSDVASLI
ncbi:Vacuolar protein sorting-associated protein 20, partial [Frankliniella fusca]